MATPTHHYKIFASKMKQAAIPNQVYGSSSVVFSWWLWRFCWGGGVFVLVVVFTVCVFVQIF